MNSNILLLNLLVSWCTGTHYRKIISVFLKIFTEVRALRVNGQKITTKNLFNPDHLGIEVNQ